MPQPKRGAAQQKAQPQKTEEQQAEEQARREAVAAAAREKLDDQYISYHEDARAIWDEDDEGQKGRLTAALFAKLEPLLGQPTPPAYIEVLEPVQGKPFKSTGLKSTQIQYDRMNDVLGVNHWRPLFYYTQQGKLCKAVIVVGNDLHWARLDDSGELLPFTIFGEGDHVHVKEADIIAVREGWGGFEMRGLGNTFKASETNAAKRAIARFGPGADVYRGELEDDVLFALRGEDQPDTKFNPAAAGNAARAPRQQQQRRAAQPQQQAAPQQEQPAPAPAPQMSEEEAATKLKALLEEAAILEVDGQDPVDLQELRNGANAAMEALPENVRPSAIARFTLINPRKDDPQQLLDLINRAQNAAGGEA